MLRPLGAAVLGVALMWSHAGAGEPVRAENESFSVAVDPATGVVESLTVKALDCDLVGEKRLAASFRILLPLPDDQAHYIEGERQTPVAVTPVDGGIDIVYSGMRTDRGEFPLDLTCRIRLDVDSVRFAASLTNRQDAPVAELWYPRIGGWTRFGRSRDAGLAVPGYIGCGHHTSLFRHFPGGRGLGSEAAEYASTYPGMTMPWWDLYDADSGLGLYMGYHDPTFRLSTWHTYLHPNAAGRPGDAWLSHEEAAGEPVGLTFSHVRYPYTGRDETFDSGEFILRLHGGDWRKGARIYRQWFDGHFPIDPEPSWLRRQGAWFTSILYQPEDRVVADYRTYDRWCREAQEYGIDCFELIGWDVGGLERAYPEYVPEEKLGGRAGFRDLLKSIEDRGGKCLVFVNYNILDGNTDWYQRELHAYTHQDTFGNTPNWMAWGESTLTARLGLSVRRHVLASVVPPLEDLLNDQFTDLVRDGAHALQMDKVVVGSALDFNPLNTMKPDTALCEGLVQAIGRTLDRCRAVDPEFRFASEAVQDRLIPLVDVFYRNSGGFDIAPLRAVFPEWTSCQHVAAPLDFNGVNAAVLTGSVICVEPDTYQGSLGQPTYRKLGEYIREVLRLRRQLADAIFLGDYFDTAEGFVREVDPATDGAFRGTPSGQLFYRVHGPRGSAQRVLTVANASAEDRAYYWEFARGGEAEADLYAPFQEPRRVSNREPLAIPSQGLHILVERYTAPDADLALFARLGISGDEAVLARDGYGLVVERGFRSAWGPTWVPPTYHCRADNDELVLSLRVPKGVEGTLRLYFIDPDSMAGGRRQDVKVEGQSLGIFEAFQAGRWVVCPVSAAATADGCIVIAVGNLTPGANAVLSLVEFRTS